MATTKKKDNTQRPKPREGWELRKVNDDYDRSKGIGSFYIGNHKEVITPDGYFCIPKPGYRNRDLCGTLIAFSHVVASTPEPKQGEE